MFKRAIHSGFGTGTDPAAGYLSLNVKPLAPAAVLIGAAEEAVAEAGVVAALAVVVAANAVPDKVRAAIKYNPLVNNMKEEDRKVSATPCTIGLYKK